MALITDTTRVNLGPLTTTFTAPVACNTPQGVGRNFTYAWRAQACDVTDGPTDETACWPPSTFIQSPIAPFIGWGFYSPGLVCPTGHTTACSATAGGASGWDVQFPMIPGETAIGCCPTGYTCTNFNGQTCHQLVTSTTFATLSCVMGSAAATELNAVVTRTIPDLEPTGAEFIRLEVFAPLFQLNYQNSDVSPRASVMTITDTGTFVTTINGTIATVYGASNDTSLPTQAPVEDGRTISSGAIAGIVIAVVLIAIGLGVFAFLVWRRRRRMGTKLPPTRDAQELEGKNWTDGRPHYETELPNERQVHEIGAPEVYELPVRRWSHDGPDASEKPMKSAVGRVCEERGVC